jgi:hypothetical protein
VALVYVVQSATDVESSELIVVHFGLKIEKVGRVFTQLSEEIRYQPCCKCYWVRYVFVNNTTNLVVDKLLGRELLLEEVWRIRAALFLIVCENFAKVFVS